MSATKSNRVTNIKVKLTGRAIAFTGMILLGILHIPARGQDFESVSAKLRSVYERADSLHVVMTVDAFDEGNSGKPFYHEKVEVKRAGVNYLYRFGALEMLMNEKYILMVDRKQKYIMCTQRDVQSENAFAKDPVKVSMDSVLSLFDKPELVAVKDSIHQYLVKPKVGDIKRIDLFVNVQQSMIKKIIYHYSDKQIATIFFNVLTTSPLFSPTLFDERAYVIITNDGIKPSKAFTGYQIVQGEEQNAN